MTLARGAVPLTWLGVACTALATTSYVRAAPAPSAAAGSDHRTAAAPIVTPSPAPPSGSVPLVGWQAPPGCSSAEVVARRLEQLLGTAERRVSPVRRVDARVTRASGGLQLELSLYDASGLRVRRLRAEHCDDLAEAAAVAIALAIDMVRTEQDDAADGVPAADEPGDVGEPAEAAVTPPSPEPATTEADAAPPPSGGPVSPPNRIEPRVASRAELLVDLATLGTTALGLSAGVLLELSELRLELAATWLPEQERSLGGAQSVSFALLAADARGCYRMGRGVIDTLLCAGAELGALAAEPARLVAARAARDVWAAPHVGLELERALSRHLALHVRGDALLPLLRQEYAVNETELVHEVPAVVVRLGVGAGIAF